MKRTLSMALVLGLITASAFAASVTSVNTVGYNSLPVKTGFNQLALNWDKVLGGDISVQNLFADVSTLTGSQSAGAADNIQFYDPNTLGYVTLYLYDGPPGYDAWDGLWIEGGAPSTRTVTSGEAFWLRIRGADTAVDVAGQVPTQATEGRSVLTGFQMFGSAFSATLDPNDGSVDWLASGAVGSQSAGAADNIQIYDPNTLGYTTLYLYDGPPGYDAWDGLWIEGGSPTSTTIPLGQGAWYRHRGAGFSWTEVKPY